MSRSGLKARGKQEGTANTEKKKLNLQAIPATLCIKADKKGRNAANLENVVHENVSISESIDLNYWNDDGSPGRGDC